MMYMYIQCILFFRFTSRRLFSQYLQIYGIVSLIWAVCRFQIGKEIFFYFREIILQWFNFKDLSAILYMYILFVWRCIWTLLAYYLHIFFMIDHLLYVFTLYIMPLIYNLYICLILNNLCLHVFEPAVHFLYWKVIINYICIWICSQLAMYTTFMIIYVLFSISQIAAQLLWPSLSPSHKDLYLEEHVAIVLCTWNRK